MSKNYELIGLIAVAAGGLLLYMNNKKDSKNNKKDSKKEKKNDQSIADEYEKAINKTKAKASATPSQETVNDDENKRAEATGAPTENPIINSDKPKETMPPKRPESLDRSKSHRIGQCSIDPKKCIAQTEEDILFG